MPFGTMAGAGVIFGTTGGVTEAVLRRISDNKRGDGIMYQPLRGLEGVKEVNIPYGDTTLHIGVVSGLGNTRKLLEALQSGSVQYDFVEIMACPGGCAGGGGQPIHDGQELAEARGGVLWRLDKGEALRFSHENPDVQALYRDYLGKPLGEKSHHLLHTDHLAWEMPQAQRGQ